MVGVGQQSQSLNDRHPGGRISHLLVDVHLSGEVWKRRARQYALRTSQTQRTAPTLAHVAWMVPKSLSTLALADGGA